MKVCIICASRSDEEVAQKAAEVLRENGVAHELHFASAHREPDTVSGIVKNSDADVFIAVAGLSAALPGFVASITQKPVIGVPVNAANSASSGLDALLAVAQMPPGVPVAAVGINNAKNAAHLAIRILKLKNNPHGSSNPMSLTKEVRRLERRGKVKDVYDAGDKLLFEFSNRVSAFDVILPSEIPHKGEVLCRLGEFFFRTLGVPNHFIAAERPNRMFVKKLDIIPVECVVRGYLYGSLFERAQSGEVSVPDKTLAAKLPEPLFDPTTKFEAKDRPVTKDEALQKGWTSEQEYEWLKKKSIELYQKISAMGDEAGFIIADIKFEFGRDAQGNILLADSIGPDEFRMWPKNRYAPGKVQEAFDKQLVRDWLIQQGYKSALDEARKKGQSLPEPPLLSDEIIKKTSDTYVYVFETLTGERFR